METDRILLRPWRESDAGMLYKYASDPEVGPRAGWPPHKSVEESLEIIRTVFNNDHTWAIVLKETGEVIGCIGYFTSGESNIGIGETQMKDNAFTVRLGQFKHSFSMENPLSPTMLELIDVYSQASLFLAGEGPDPLNGVNYGRDMGLMVFGSLFSNHLLYELAVMNGQGINRRDGNNYKDLIAKLDFRPVDGFRVVCSAQKGKGHAVGTAAWNPGVALGDDYTRDRVSVGAEWKMPTTAGAQSASGGVSVRGEFMAGKDGDVNSRGGYLTGCVPIGKGVDIVASADYFDRNTDMDYAQTQLTGGIQYWFFKKCRLQLQYTRTFSDFQDDYNWLQAQVQVAF